MDDEQRREREDIDRLSTVQTLLGGPALPTVVLRPGELTYVPIPDPSNAAERRRGIARAFAAEWLRPTDPDHANPAMVDTLSTAMLAFFACARGVK